MISIPDRVDERSLRPLSLRRMSP